jgi:hypothetical protein
MSQPLPDDDYAPDVPVATPPLIMARAFLENARAIGEPGGPNMIEGAALQQQHANMASSAALVSIAESLNTMLRMQANTRLRLARAVTSLHTLSRDIEKIRYAVTRGRK